jgi:hypothetical protein
MKSGNDELERLKRLRERQLQARDPLVKKRELQRRLAAQQRRARRQQPSLMGIFGDMLADIPARWKGIVVGALLGTVVSIVLALVNVDAIWVLLVWLVGGLFLAVGGFIIGRAFDWRDEVRDEFR